MGNLSRFDIQGFIDKFDLKYFVETGTHFGAGLSYAAKFPFDKIFSIEINKDCYKFCVFKFHDDKRISLIDDTSANGLKQIGESLKDGNTLFWLDGHYPFALDGVNWENYNLGEESIRLPLETELEIIRNYNRNQKDVFLIDDLRIYEDGNFGVGNLPSEIRSPKEKNINFILDNFPNHCIERDYDDEGYLILTPKD